jgi:hypothetical protein
MKKSSKIPQTQRDESPKKAVVKWQKLLKFNRVKIKNYLYFLLYKALKHKNWSLLEWKFAEEASKIIRHQLPELYVSITFLLLNMKENKKLWGEIEYHFEQSQDWLPRNLVRAAHGVGKGEIPNLSKVESEFLKSSTAIRGNLVLFEQGVEEDSRLVTDPIFKRGYKDHGSCVPDHKKGRNLGHSREPDPLYTKIGDNPEEDIEFLDILGTTEFYHFLNRMKN